MLNYRVNTSQQGIPQTLPAPIGGLNGRDALAVMDPRDAFFMDNLIPSSASVDSRKGTVGFVATLGAPVKSLEVYTGGAGDQMLAFAGGQVYNVTTGIASSLVSGKLNDDVITAMFSNAATNAQFMLVTTGTDTPYSYDGAAIANLTITGITGSVSTLNFVAAFKGRVYFGQRDKLGFYYLPVGQIQGAASYFDLAQVSLKGGYLVAIASFSSEASGVGPRDYIVFITSKGECIVYDGFDPSAAANWVLVGRYFAAPPIGKKCTFNYNTELVLLTLDGAVPFSEIRRAGVAKASGVSDADYTAITSKLGKYLSDLNTYADVGGWQGTVYSLGGLLLINTPASASPSGAYNLFAMNTTTNAWTRITRWNGISYCVFNRRLYFGKFDGRIMLADEGRLDDGEAILCDCKQAYNYFDGGSGKGAYENKHFQWANLFVECDGKPPLSAQFNVDFLESQPEYLLDVDDSLGAPWDTSDWDIAEWGSDGRTQQVLVTLNKAGTVGSLWFRASLNGLTLKWFATGYVFTKLRGLLI